MKNEQAVLASMMKDESCSQDYGLLSESDFEDKFNQKIFKAIKTLVQNEKKVDHITVINEMKEKTGVKYIADITSSLPNTRHFRDYVGALKDKALKRRIEKLAGNLIDPKMKGQELAEYAEQEIFKLREESSTDTFPNFQDIMFNAYSEIEDIYSGKKERGLMTGFVDLDNIMGGMRKQEYILLGARPSIGKTALGINIAENQLIKGKSVAFFSYEMSEAQLANRMIKSASLVSSRRMNKVNGAELIDEDWKKLQNSASYMGQKKMFLDDNPTRTVAEIQAKCRKIKREEGLDLVIIDYLQKIRSTSSGESRHQLEQVSNDIKNMAKLLDVPVIVITSLSRANQHRDIKVPILSDLRESGQLEFDADVVLFLHREYYHDRSDESLKEDADVIVAKNRNGQIGRSKLIWKADFTKFLNVPNRHQQY